MQINTALRVDLTRVRMAHNMKTNADKVVEGRDPNKLC